MKKVAHSTRRSFLKSAAKTSAVVAVGGLAFAGCSNDIPRSKNGIKISSEKKKETLYRSTKNWIAYYAAAQ